MSEKNEIAPAQRAELSVGARGLELNNFDAMWRFSNCIAQSGFAPRGMEKPESIIVALQLAAEVGMSPMSGIQNIGVINGRPGIYGDAALALVRASGELETYKEEEIGERGKDTWGQRVTVKRKGFDSITEEFTVADAKTAQLWGKSGPWSQYPKRMMKFRARSFALRDSFGDVLKGMTTTEELQDMPRTEVNVTPQRNAPQFGLEVESFDGVEPGKIDPDTSKGEEVVEPKPEPKPKKERPAKAEEPKKPDAKPAEDTSAVDDLKQRAEVEGIQWSELERYAKGRDMDPNKPTDAKRLGNAFSTISDAIRSARPKGKEEDEIQF